MSNDNPQDDTPETIRKAMEEEAERGAFFPPPQPDHVIRTAEVPPPPIPPHPTSADTGEDEATPHKYPSPQDIIDGLADLRRDERRARTGETEQDDISQRRQFGESIEPPPEIREFEKRGGDGGDQGNQEIINLLRQGIELLQQIEQKLPPQATLA